MLLFITILIQVNSFNISLIPSFGTSPNSIFQGTAAYAQSNNRALIFGGRDVNTNQLVNSIYTFNITSSVWGEIFSQSYFVPPGLTLSNSIITASQMLLIFFGSKDTGISSDVFAFDLITNSWTSAQLSGSRIPGHTTFGFASFIFENSSYVVIFGGTTVSGSSTTLYM